MSKPTSTISALIDEHVPADASETDALRRIKELVVSATEPFSRDQYVPGHLTASAIIFDDAREHVMLIFHQKLQLWLQPGGHFEPGETDPNVAAAREVLEETGLTCRWPGGAPALHDVDVHLIPARKTEPQHSHFDLRMLLISARVPGTAGDGVSAARWFRREAALAMNLDPGLVRALRKIG